MTKTTTGGCFCGEIRYEITGDPVIQVMCFCEDCRSITGTDAYAGFMVKETEFHQLEGTPQQHQRTSKEGRKVVRSFCRTCGTNLWGVTSFGLISVAAGTLDDPGLFQPKNKAFTEGAPHWARIPEHLEDI